MKTRGLNVVKSFILLILIGSLSLVIVSCDKSNYKAEKEDSKPTNKLGQITKATLTDREKGLVSSLGGINTYVFDVKLNKDINSDWVDLWIDHYEKGILKEPSQFISSGLTIGEKKTLNSTFIFSVESFSGDTKVEKWILANNGASATSLKVKDSKFNSFSSMSNNNIEIIEDTILNLVILKQGKQSNSLATSVFSDEEELKKDIAETEHLYILRCKFSNKLHEK